MICWIHPGWVVNWKESLDFNPFQVLKHCIISWIHWTWFANWQKNCQTFIWMLCMKLYLHSQVVCFDKWNCNTVNDLVGLGYKLEYARNALGIRNHIPTRIQCRVPITKYMRKEICLGKVFGIRYNFISVQSLHCTKEKVAFWGGAN